MELKQQQITSQSVRRTNENRLAKTCCVLFSLTHRKTWNNFGLIMKYFLHMETVTGSMSRTNNTIAYHKSLRDISS